MTERVSVSSHELQGNSQSDLPQRGDFVSADGRFVVFTSGSALVLGDTGWHDVFIRDRQNGTTERVSVNSAGKQANGHSWLFGIAISRDGRFVAYYSEASNLVSGDTNGAGDIFLRDRLNGTTERVSIASNGAQGNGASEYPAVSDDGRYVVFDTRATNLVPADTNGFNDILIRDRLLGTTERVSVTTAGAQAWHDSFMPTISGDGRYVAFASTAGNLDGGSFAFRDVFVRDRQMGTTECVSGPTGGGDANGHVAWWSQISRDGRYVVFSSLASNLVPTGDHNNASDIFVHDRRTGVTQRVSEGPGGTPANGDSKLCSISADGRVVAFNSNATNLIPGSFTYGVFAHDMLTGTNEVVSVSTGGTLGTGSSEMPSISGDGRYVVFRSDAPNLVAGDTNGWVDIFVHDRLAAGLTSLCAPGSAGVINCPCANPPSGPARGCDNSSATGGASLTASGIAYLSIDSLVFTTGDQKPSATSIVLKGNAAIPTGAVFGQGVRCAGGTLLRLYVKKAVLGSITAPDLTAGDPTISSRCTALGAPIQPGEPHLYLVYYRDSTVLGGCPASSTFNTTQTASISWWP